MLPRKPPTTTTLRRAGRVWKIRLTLSLCTGSSLGVIQHSVTQYDTIQCNSWDKVIQSDTIWHNTNTTQCDKIQHSVTQYATIQCNSWHNATQSDTMWYNTIQHNVTKCGTMWHNMTQYNATVDITPYKVTQCDTIQIEHNVTKYNTMWQNVTQSNTSDIMQHNVTWSDTIQ